MEKFLDNPNIPRGKVTAVLLGARYLGALEAPLAARGVRVLALDEDSRLDGRVSAHADMLAHHLGGNEWIATDCAAKTLEKLENISVYRTSAPISPTYPDDIALNVLRLGGSAYGRFDAACSTLLEHLCKRGVERVSVKQGYAKCSVCVVSDRAAITADKGLAAAMRSRGVDVLEIAPGGVRLDGYDAGFFGGATGLIATDELAITGRLNLLPDGEAIKAFLAKHGVRAVELTDGVPLDVGSILPVFEEWS